MHQAYSESSGPQSQDLNKVLESAYVDVSGAMRERMAAPLSADDYKRLTGDFPSLKGDEVAARIHRELLRQDKTQMALLGGSILTTLGSFAAVALVNVFAGGALLALGAGCFVKGSQAQERAQRLTNALYHRIGSWGC